MPTHKVSHLPFSTQSNFPLVTGNSSGPSMLQSGFMQTCRSCLTRTNKQKSIWCAHMVEPVV